MLALGQLIVILTRGIDLSVGANLSLSAVVGAIVWRDNGSAMLAVLAALGTATLVGLINGVVYVKGRLPHPFIPTLAMLTAASGLALYLSDSKTIQGVPPFVDEIGSGRIASIPGGGPVGWFPTATIVVVAVAALVWLITRRLVWGRWIYAVGGNPEAALAQRDSGAGRVDLGLHHVRHAGGCRRPADDGQGQRGIADRRQPGRTRRDRGGHHRRRQLSRRSRQRPQRDHRCADHPVMRNGFNLLGIDPNWQYIATGVVIVVAVELDVVRGSLESRFRSMQAAAAS